MKFREAKLRMIAILLEESEKTRLPLSELIFELMRAHNQFGHLHSVPVPRITEIETNQIKAVNKRMILDALAKNNGNQRATAQQLGMSKSTLHDWIKRWKATKEINCV